MALVKTVMGRDALGNAIKVREVYTFTTAGADEVFSCEGAKSAMFSSAESMTVKIPKPDAEGELTASENVIATVTDNGLIVNSGEGTMGYISESVMPPFFVLTVAGTGTAAGFCYINY